MNKKNIIAGLIALSACGCTQIKQETPVQEAIISGYVDTDKLQSARVYRVDYESALDASYIEVDIKDKQFKFSLPVNPNGEILTYRGAPVFVQPGDSVHLEFNPYNKEKSITFSGNHAELNESLLNMPPSSGFNSGKLYESMKSGATLQEVSFTYDSLVKVANNQYAKLNNVPAVAQEFVEQNNKAAKAYFMSIYTYYNKDVDLSPFFLRLRKDLVSSDFLDFVMFRNVGEFLTRNDNKKLIGGEEINEHYYILNRVKTARSNIKYMLSEKSVAFVDSIMALLPTEYASLLKEDYDKSMETYRKLGKGAEAPLFSALTAEGQKRSLSDFKGKVVYIDVWATWCGPCRFEAPHFEKLAEEFKDNPNVTFLTVSIDEQTEREKWIKMIAKKKYGEHLLVSNAWKNEIVTEYKINGIPRFILIDQNGKIISADAPRPSNPDEVKSLIESALNLS
ncbi:TlpA disulfide reductase family protein [Limibacter armeniacum]|uniref:TlpA family protein disulfide reductase n=1 Tax=Limibacter armeniacum TaxID=466084 RepID=UPI002FE573E5